MSDKIVPPVDPKKALPKEWHPQQSKLLQSWAEIASSYRWMHNQAYMIYKKKNMWFMLPLIIMSTVTGTANFAQSTFPTGIRPYVPQIIGAINLISAIMTTIYQFLKISEFMESHRISSINYGKLARTLTVELNLPVKDRNSGGAECVKISRTEIDRLIEQSPAIPKNVLISYEHQFSGRGLSEPEIIVINKVDIYEDRENTVANTVAEAGLKLKNSLFKKRLNVSESPVALHKENLNRELQNLPKLVSKTNEPSKESINFGSVVSEVLGRFNKKAAIVPPKFIESHEVPESISPKMSQLSAIDIPEINFTILNESVEESVEDIETGKVIDEIVDGLVEETAETVSGISSDLELLRSSKLVSGNK